MTAFCTLRLAWGLVLLAAPGSVLRAAGGHDETRRARRVAQVLGLRHLAQAAVLASRRSARATTLNAGVDGLHGLSMVALAARGGDSARPAALDALLASGWTAAGLMLARRLRAGEPAQAG